MFKVSESFEETPIDQEDLDNLLAVIKGSFKPSEAEISDLLSAQITGQIPAFPDEMPLRRGSYSIQVPYKLKGEDDLYAHAAFVCSKSTLPRMDIATVQKFFALAANPANHPGAKKLSNPSPPLQEESKEVSADSDDEVAAPSPKATIPLHFNCKQALVRELGIMNLVEVH